MMYIVPILTEEWSVKRTYILFFWSIHFGLFRIHEKRLLASLCVCLSASFCPAPTGQILVKFHIGDFCENPNLSKVGQEGRRIIASDVKLSLFRA